LLFYIVELFPQIEKILEVKGLNSLELDQKVSHPILRNSHVFFSGVVAKQILFEILVKFGAKYLVELWNPKKQGLLNFISVHVFLQEIPILVLSQLLFISFVGGDLIGDLTFPFVNVYKAGFLPFFFHFLNDRSSWLPTTRLFHLKISSNRGSHPKTRLNTISGFSRLRHYGIHYVPNKSLFDKLNLHLVLLIVIDRTDFIQQLILTTWNVIVIWVHFHAHHTFLFSLC
jgi:hypothetical protein